VSATRAWVLAAGLAAAVPGTALLAGEAWIAAKARVAEVCIARAYEAHRRDGRDHRPWSWADTTPIARLAVARLGVRRIVLAGASGSSLAFGPGHLDGSAPPNGPGTCVLAGHRDGAFAFLAALVAGDVVEVETHGRTRRYRVRELAVRSMWDLDVLAMTGEDRLVLVTCYPFGGPTRSAWRYVVICDPTPFG